MGEKRRFLCNPRGSRAVPRVGGIALALALLAAAPGALAWDPPGRSAWLDFPVLVWRQHYSRAEAPAPLLEPFGGTNVEGPEEAAWVRERGYAFYVGHGPGRNALHLERTNPAWAERADAWYASRDEALLADARMNAPTPRPTRRSNFEIAIRLITFDDAAS